MNDICSMRAKPVSESQETLQVLECIDQVLGPTRVTSLETDVLKVIDQALAIPTMPELLPFEELDANTEPLNDTEQVLAVPYSTSMGVAQPNTTPITTCQVTFPTTTAPQATLVEKVAETNLQGETAVTNVEEKETLRNAQANTSTETLNETSPKFPVRQRKFKEKSHAIFQDLVGLSVLIQERFHDLKDHHQHMKTTMNGGEVKEDFILAARDIYDLSTNIVRSWKPMADKCSDLRLAKTLALSLVQVEVLAGQLRAITNQKQNDKRDKDSQGQLLVCASNVLHATLIALSDLKAANVRLYQDATE